VNKGQKLLPWRETRDRFR